MYELFFNSVSAPGVKVLTDSGNLVTISETLARELRARNSNLKAFANFVESYVNEGEPPFYWAVGITKEDECVKGLMFLADLSANLAMFQVFFILMNGLELAFVPEASTEAAEFIVRNLKSCASIEMLYSYKFFPLEIVSTASKLEPGHVMLERSGRLVYEGVRVRVEWPFESRELRLVVKPNCGAPS
ncbi:MAG: hypothetical protein ACP5HQ_03700 [Thermoprotei archaeon]